MLKATIRAIFGDPPSRAAVGHLVEESHRMALAYLVKKARRGTLNSEHFGLSVDDLALDCIADLFRRDEAGRFVHLAEYFEGVGWSELDEASLRIALRRLVFSKVNEGFFRRHRKHDPELARIIRNVKNAVNARPSVELVRRGRELWLVVAGTTSMGEKPPMPFELLEAYLTRHLHATRHIPEVVELFEQLTDRAPMYAAGYPVSRFALAVRAAHVRLVTVPEPPEVPAPFTDEEVAEAIVYATQRTIEAFRVTYVDSGKLDEQTFDAYARATYDLVAGQFSSAAVPVASYYDGLCAYIPDLSKGTYRSRHRHVLEYMVKTVRQALMDHLCEQVDAVTGRREG